MLLHQVPGISTIDMAGSCWIAFPIPNLKPLSARTLSPGAYYSLEALSIMQCPFTALTRLSTILVLVPNNEDTGSSSSLLYHHAFSCQTRLLSPIRCLLSQGANALDRKLGRTWCISLSGHRHGAHEMNGKFSMYRSLPFTIFRLFITCTARGVSLLFWSPSPEHWPYKAIIPLR